MNRNTKFGAKECPKCGSKPGQECKVPQDCWYSDSLNVIRGALIERDLNRELKEVPDTGKDLDDFIFKPKKRPNMKKAIRWIRDTLSGDNKAGELIHGALDVLPIPNQAIAKAVKALLSGDRQEAKAELPNIFTTRNIVALVASVAYFAGWITLQDLQKLIEAISSFI